MQRTIMLAGVGCLAIAGSAYAQRAALVQDVDAAARNAVQVYSVAQFNGVNNQFYTVPAGKRLMITYLSFVSIDVTSSPFVQVSCTFNGLQVFTFFTGGAPVPVNGRSTSVLSAPTTMTCDPGTVAFAATGSTTEPVQGTLSGYLINYP